MILLDTAVVVIDGMTTLKWVVWVSGAGFARDGRFVGALFAGDSDWRFRRLGLRKINATALPHHV